ncbi:hypothetical protein B0T14DRAFT_562342 [Immersiella caudata]|uniref:Uncharacterized protein n=1 Tax=Immersiella caudata TaxID=314043 RepID=A0AA39X419_9PEZI|nr:hypothetical protein B0T14DRAFT_562342 [Immersiella caudata]
MGWTYNTADPDAPTMGPLIAHVALVLTVVSLATVLLRAYVRFHMIKAAGIDDWIIFATWVQLRDADMEKRPSQGMRTPG